MPSWKRSYGPTCPHCGACDRIYELKGKSTRIGVRKCGHCRKPFTVKVGTVFESSHISLHKWLQAVFLMCASKARAEEELKLAGRKAGQGWARTAAEWDELKRVATYERWGETREEDYPTTLVCLIMDVPDRRAVDRSDERDLWEQLHDHEVEPDPAWIEGFVDGVTEVWGEVADKV
jgi:transcription elongation factor Elf1